MKRSEILNIIECAMNDTSASYCSDTSEEILSRIEEAGMLPPGFEPKDDNYKIPLDFFDHIYEWELESEE